MKAIILMALFQLNLNAATKVIDSEVNFTAVGRPAFIKATGILPIEKADLTLKEGMLTGNIEVPLSKLNSGIETRDEHLKEKYLEVAKYPKALLSFTNIPLKELKEGQNIKAKLTLHGQTREIPLEVKVEGDKSRLKVESDFEVILTDFNIELPSFQGITAAKNVKIKVDSTFSLDE
tara:strand:+ start:985 stop:1515 length:531 start_codon:yes stop_codon:yes gene_type:complete